MNSEKIGGTLTRFKRGLDCSPIGITGATGYLLHILSPVMSFAIAEYDNGGKDILVATDRRWVSGTTGSYTIVDDKGLKSIDLNKSMAIAFTGQAQIMAEIVGRLYQDPSLLQFSHRDALKRLEERSHSLDMNLGEIVTCLDEIVPRSLDTLGIGYNLSIILAGNSGKDLVMYGWSKETKWRGKPNFYGEYRRIRTLPPEAVLGTVLQKRADQILDGHGGTAFRIRCVVKFFSEQNPMGSVGGGCIMRRFSQGFLRH